MPIPQYHTRHFKGQSTCAPRRQAGRALPVAAGALALLAAIAAAWWALRQPAAPEAGPAATTGLESTLARASVPVIIYLIDTLRADRLQVYGYPRPTSPVMNDLARDSVVFENALAPSPWTLPAVASLVTSTFACEHGVVNAGLSLDPAIPTLAQRLRRSDYATAAYYGNLYAGPTAGLDRGYQVSEFREDMGSRDGEVKKFLDTAGEGPFLLYVHTMEPHQAYLVDYRYTKPFGHVPVETKAQIEADWNRYKELRVADFQARRPLGTTDNTTEQKKLIARFAAERDAMDTMYDGSVRQADESLGTVIAVLKARGVWDRALFILIADHGEEFGEHGVWFHEQSVYQSVMHVPLIIHFPHGEFGGRRVGAVVSLVDITPTILDYVGGTDRCEGCRGSSLMALARGSATAIDRGPVPGLRINRTSYYRPYKEAHGDINVVMRREPWKAIWNAEPGSLELYDLGTDPGERRNLAKDQPAVAGELRTAATDWLRNCDATLREPARVEIDPRIREKLHALGYAH